MTKKSALVIKRLETVPVELHFSSGAFENFSRDQMIQEIKHNTPAGREFVRIEMEFLRAVEDGSFLEGITLKR